MGVTMDDVQRERIEAAVFRRLVQHLMQDRPDVQNIDLMNLAGFCRNCLSRWYQEAAEADGIVIDKVEGRRIVYGMPYDDWVAANQRAASADQQAAFAQAFAANVGKPG